MGWYQEARDFSRNIQSSINVWGQARYMNNFAEGGISSYMFPTEDIKIRRGLFGGKVRPGSRAYMANLQQVIDRGSQYSSRFGYQARAAEAMKLKQQYSGFAKRFGAGNLSLKGMAFGGALAGGFLAYTAYSTEGGLYEKTKTTIGSAAGLAAWGPGMSAGAAIGGTIGALIPIPFAGAVGALAGAAIGGLAANFAATAVTESAIDAMDRVAGRGRRRRMSNWVGDMSAFRTQKAATIRQASLQMMNNGMMTARNALGNEGMMFHQ